MHARFHDPEPAPVAGFDNEDDRLARIAARRAFVDMKSAFARAAGQIEGSLGEHLRLKVRRATEAVELWRLRGVLLASLSPHDAVCAEHRLELHRQLDSVFPESGIDTGFVPLEPGAH